MNDAPRQDNMDTKYASGTHVKPVINSTVKVGGNEHSILQKSDQISYEAHVLDGPVVHKD